MEIENPSPAPETPPAAPVQTENQTRESVQTPSPSQPAPPPAANLVVNGDVTDERALALARREREISEREARARQIETEISEREAKINEREEILSAAPRPKRQKLILPTVFDEDE